MDNNQLYQIVLIATTLVMCSMRAYSNAQVFSYRSWLQRHWPWWLATDVPTFLAYWYGWKVLMIHPIYLLASVGFLFSLHHIFYWIGENTLFMTPQDKTPSVVFWLSVVVCGSSVVVAWEQSIAGGTLSQLVYATASLCLFVIVLYSKVR